MSRFFMQYHSQTLAALANKEQLQSTQLPMWKFDLPDASMVLGDLVRSVGGINLHNGLHMIIEVKADSREEAESLSKNHCETVLNLITFSTLAFCDSGHLVSIIRFDQQNLPFFRYYIHLSGKREMFGSPVLIDEVRFRKVYESFYNQSDIACQQRVMRALSWLRKGINEEDGVDEFVSYWVGLEVIKCRLRRRLKKAGQEKDPDEWAGVEPIYEETTGRKDFGKVKNARNGLLHGFRELSPDFVEEIKGYVKPIQKALIASIAVILGLTDDIADQIVTKDVRRALRQWHVIEGDVKGLPNDLNRLALSYPKAELESSGTDSYEFDEEGNLTIRGSYNVRFAGVPNATWHVKATELWSGKDSGIKQGKLSVRKHDQK